jgi:hypothetical protein
MRNLRDSLYKSDPPSSLACSDISLVLLLLVIIIIIILIIIILIIIIIGLIVIPTFETAA